jgi:hypothetical protein
VRFPPGDPNTWVSNNARSSPTEGRVRPVPRDDPAATAAATDVAEAPPPPPPPLLLELELLPFPASGPPNKPSVGAPEAAALMAAMRWTGVVIPESQARPEEVNGSTDEEVEVEAEEVDDDEEEEEEGCAAPPPPPPFLPPAV